MDQKDLAQVSVDRFQPEWLRIDAVVKLFGISRSKIYELIADKRVKSFSLRDRGAIKGIRLVSYDSLCRFLDREADAQLKEEGV